MVAMPSWRWALTRELMSKATINRLEAMGWRFYPNGPNEYDWMKFEGDTRVAMGGDETWSADVREAETAHG